MVEILHLHYNAKVSQYKNLHKNMQKSTEKSTWKSANWQYNAYLLLTYAEFCILIQQGIMLSVEQRYLYPLGSRSYRRGPSPRE